MYNRSPGAHVEVNPVSPYEQYYAKGNHDPKTQIGVFVEYQDKQTVLTHYERSRDGFNESKNDSAVPVVILQNPG